MNKDKTLIALVLDASGSMGGLQSATIEAINSFVDSQLKVPGEVEFYVRTFDTSHKVIRNFVKLDKHNYSPNGGTALLDAIGFTIDEIGSDLAKRTANNRPGKVIVAVMTDGEENSSVEFRGQVGKERIASKIKHQTDKYSWDFTFLGANQDAIQAGQDMGFMAQNAINFSGSVGGVKNVVAHNLSSYATRSRTTGSVGYSDIEREVSMEDEEIKSP